MWALSGVDAAVIMAKLVLDGWALGRATLRKFSREIVVWHAGASIQLSGFFDLRVCGEACAKCRLVSVGDWTLLSSPSK